MRALKMKIIRDVAPWAYQEKKLEVYNPPEDRRDVLLKSYHELLKEFYW